MDLTYDAVRASGQDPRVHGNGFAQVDMPGGVRLHFWGHPDIPRQRVSTPIHDHAFGFSSLVLRGRLINIVHLLDAGHRDSDHRVWGVRPRVGADTELVRTEVVGRLIVASADVIMPGSVYEMRVGVLHETVVTCPTITALSRTEVNVNYPARVLAPLGVEPDNSFDRYATPADTIWGIIREIMS